MAPLTFAHRGGLDGGFPQNSLAAFADALDRRCDLETDLRMSADGQVVCAHDRFAFAGLLPVWIALMPASLLGRLGVPTLARLYAELGTGFELSADVKVRGAAVHALTVARDAGAIEHLWLVSDDLATLADLRARDAQVRLVHEARHRDLATEPISPLDHLDRLVAQQINAANTTVSDWTQTLVDHAHALGLRTFGSLLQTRAAMDRAVSLGVDAFYSDHLELMRAAVEST